MNVTPIQARGLIPLGDYAADDPPQIEIAPALQAARLWTPWRERPRVPGSPSKTILDRAATIHGILDALKREAHEPDNATKAALVAMRV